MTHQSPRMSYCQDSLLNGVGGYILKCNFYNLTLDDTLPDSTTNSAETRPPKSATVTNQQNSALIVNVN